MNQSTQGDPRPNSHEIPQGIAVELEAAGELAEQLLHRLSDKILLTLREALVGLTALLHEVPTWAEAQQAAHQRALRKVEFGLVEEVSGNE
jgi:hypothetical protein